MDVGVDLSEFYMSVEWDILEVPAVRWDCNNLSMKLGKFILFDEFLTLELAQYLGLFVTCILIPIFSLLAYLFMLDRNEKFYTCCDEPYLDISEYQRRMKSQTMYSFHCSLISFTYASSIYFD